MSDPAALNLGAVGETEHKVAGLPKQNGVYAFFWTVDSYLSSWGFEVWDGLKRGLRAYTSFLNRFRISGIRRISIDLLDDAATFGTAFAFVLLAFALPPFSLTGDVWNKDREYALTMTDANGEIIGRRGIRQDDAIPLEDIPKHVVDAVLATEDSRFYQHFGVDVIGTFRAIVENAKANEVVQGGSSLTQQVAKNLFLSPERSMRRKIHEAFLALWIEARLSKDEILKLYLDRSYLGGGTYGVEAASQYYFGKSIRDVNVSEAATLAGLFKAPTKFAPHRNIGAAWSRANTVLTRMLEAGFITPGEFTEARRTPPQIVAQARFDSPDWFLDWSSREALDILERHNITGDYVLEVKTTIDPKLQDAAQRIVNQTLDEEAPAWGATQAASVTMTPDGAVRAIVGGRDYENSQFNRATDALRQSGSSFKPFVYMTALLAGYKPSSVVLDGPVTVGNWSPKNYSGKYAGRTTLTNALAHSYNSVPVRLMLDVGRKAIIATAHQAGIQGEIETWPPMVLGTSALSLIDLTTGYATFAASGRLARPYSVLEIRRPNGDVLYSRDANAPTPTQAFPEEIVADLNQMMNAVVTSGTGQRALLGFTPQAGKTGTNQGYRDAWYIGFTANNVTGVWFGNDDFTPMKELTGGKLPAATWKKIMMEAERGKEPMALAGLPLDESYLRFAAENPDMMPAPEPGTVTVAAVPPTTATDAIPATSTAETSETEAAPEPPPTKTKTIDDPPAVVIRPPKRAKASAESKPVRAERREDVEPPPAPRRVERIKKQRVAAIEDEPPPRRRVRVVRPRRIVDTEVEVDPQPERRESRDPVVQVLKDMFGLPDNEQPRRPRLRRKNPDLFSFLPQANTRKKRRNQNTLFDQFRKRKALDR
jgi:penicillin-binding protein 1A